MVMEHFFFLRAAEASLQASRVRSAPDNLLWLWSDTLRARRSENARSLEVTKNVSEGLFFFSKDRSRLPRYSCFHFYELGLEGRRRGEAGPRTS